MKFSVGDRFGNLTIERIIGAGAFGVVYAARDELLRRRVALKVVRTAEAGAVDRERVLSEARSVGALQSPAVATLYRIHELPRGSGWALELEHVDGHTLAERTNNGEALGVVEALRIFAGICAALEAAHAAGVVHGDIKPANVLLDRAGAIKVVDFGVARMLGGAAQDARLAGGGGGTPTYMAPEVVMGDPARPASDMWSVGVVLHRILAGTPPFRCDTTAELLPAVLNDAPRPLPPEVPARVASIVVRCLDKDPARRPQADASLQAELDLLIEQAAREERRREVRDGGPVVLPGREQALAQLAAAIDDASSATGRIVLIEAAAGYGVSTTLAAGATMAEKAGFHAVRAALTPESGALQRIAEELGDAFEVLRKTAHVSPRKLLAAVEEWLRAATAETPVALVVDDVQHASPADQGILQELGRRCEHLPVLLLLGRRIRTAGEAPFFSSDAAHERIALAPLAPTALTSMLMQLGDGAPFDTELVSRICRSTEGNPLFATELFNHLRSSGAITLQGGRWRPRTGTSLPIPEELEQLFTHRLEALAPTLREMLDVAAVDGREFDAAAIVAVLDRSLLDVLRALQRLYRDHDFVVPVEHGYRFRHELARDIIYRSIEPSLRTEFHRRLAAHLEQRSDEVSSERIGVHWEAAGEQAKAAPHLRRAMHDAAADHDLFRALAFAERGGLLDDPCDPAILDDPSGWRTLTGLLASASRIDDLQRIYATLLAHVRAAGDTENLFALLVQRARHLQLCDRAAELQLDQIRSMLAPHPEPRTLAWAHIVLGRAAQSEDDGTEATTHFSRALELSRDLDGAEPFVPAATQLAGVYSRVGRPEEAESLYREGAARCAKHGDRGKQAIQLVNMALASFRRGVLEGIEATIHDAMVSIAVEQAPTTHSHVGLVLASVLYAVADTAAAHRQAQSSLEQARETAFRPSLTEGGVHAAAIAIAVGDPEEVGVILEQAMGAAQRAHDTPILAQLHAIEAQHHWLAGRPREADEAHAALLATIAKTTQCEPIFATLPWVAESVMYGMDPAVLDAVQERVASVAPPDLCGRADLLALAAGAHAFRNSNGSIADLREAASRMRHPAFGDRRALLRTLGLWLGAEAANRAGETDDAHAQAAEALAHARRLAHVWLEADLERYAESL